MHALLAALQAAHAGEDGLTFSEVIANIPHDAATIFVYVLLLVTFGTIFWVGRPRKGPPPWRS